jgi:hypothetical protein
LSTRADPDALVAALGGGVHQRIAIFFAQERSPSRIRLALSSLVFVLTLAVAFRGPYRALLVPFITVVILPIVALMQRRRIVVGGDGISIEPAVPFLAKRTFVPFASLDGLLRKDERATLIIDGQPRSFSLPKRKGRKEPFAATTALIARIDEAGARYAKGTAANTDARILTGMLAREGRPLGAWLEAVRANVHLGPSQRRLAVEPDRLLSMAEDPAVDGEVRAAAAVVLAEVPDPNVQERLRAAANVTAEPALRRVLELATTPDESGLFDALDDVPPSRRFGEEDANLVREEPAARELLDGAPRTRDKTGPR